MTRIGPDEALELWQEEDLLALGARHSRRPPED